MTTGKISSPASGSFPPWTLPALFAVVFAVQIPLILNADLGWLLTVCEKILGGARLGRDIQELNPPLSIFIYMPAAWLGQVLRAPPHILLIPMLLAFAWASANLAIAFLRPAPPAKLENEAALRLILLVILTLLPGPTFGQREHISSMALLPFVALAAAGAGDGLERRIGSRRAAGLRVLAGCLAGLAMSLKPYLALVAGLPLLWNAWQARSLRPLLGVETWSAAAVVIGYFGWALLVFPEYFSTWPRIIALTYLPVRTSISEQILSLTSLSVVAVVVLLRLGYGDFRNLRPAAPWLAAALGGLITYFITGKIFTYLRLPAFTFAAVAVLTAPAVLGWRLSPRALALFCVCAEAPVLWLLPGWNPAAVFEKTIAEQAAARPRMTQIGSSVGLGEPLVRVVGGEWVSPVGSQIVAGGAIMRLWREKDLPPDTRGALQALARADRDQIRRDIVRSAPDAIMVGNELFGYRFGWLGWARRDPVIARELDAHYVLVRNTRFAGLLLRRETMRAAPPQ